MTQERQWQSTGQRVEVDGQVDRIPPYDPRSGQHLWVWLMAFRANPALMDDPTHTPMLDRETLLSIKGPGCYYCEQPYTPRLLRRRCPGDPR